LTFLGFDFLIFSLHPPIRLDLPLVGDGVDDEVDRGGCLAMLLDVPPRGLDRPPGGLTPPVDFDLNISAERSLTSVGIACEVFGRLTSTGNAFSLPRLASAVLAMLETGLVEVQGIDMRFRFANELKSPRVSDVWSTLSDE
jgi:hypothetical protein